MVLPERAVLLSIRPGHANNILAGSKTVELRRMGPRVKAGDLALIYVTRPISAVVARFTVAGVVSGHPRWLWPTVRDRVGLDRPQYDDYYSGATKATAIFLADVRELPEPVPLIDLEEAIPGFRPPQSFRYVSVCDLGARILAAVGA